MQLCIASHEGCHRFWTVSSLRETLATCGTSAKPRIRAGLSEWVFSARQPPRSASMDPTQLPFPIGRDKQLRPRSDIPASRPVKWLRQVSVLTVSDVVPGRFAERKLPIPPCHPQRPRRNGATGPRPGALTFRTVGVYQSIKASAATAGRMGRGQAALDDS
jgi:hypothetical protein